MVLRFLIPPVAGLRCASQCLAVRHKTGVGGTNIYGVVVEVVAKRKMLVI